MPKTTIQVLEIDASTKPIQVTKYSGIEAVLQPARVDMRKWPSCRVVVQSFREVEEDGASEFHFLFHQNGEIPEGYLYAGTVVNANPRYLAHLLYKIVPIN